MIHACSLAIRNPRCNPLGRGGCQKAIDKLKHIDWFKKSVRDIRAFKIEDWSDFTEIVKEEEK